MSLTVREIRRRWKPTKESLIAASEHEGLRVRIHRACSWLERAAPCLQIANRRGLRVLDMTPRSRAGQAGNYAD